MNSNKTGNLGIESATSRLYDLAKRLDRYRADRRAVCIHLSRLKPYHRRNHHLRIAEAFFRGGVRTLMGELFILDNSDFFFIAKEASVADIDNAVIKLRTLFKDDPLVTEEATSAGDGFCTWYDLETDYEAFFKDVTAIAVLENEGLQTANGASDAGDELLQEKQPMDLDKLVRMERLLATADISNLVRYQTVCALAANQAPQPVLSECFTSISELERVLMPDTDISVNRGLFQHLTQILDRRMLALLKREGTINRNGYLSININLATVMSPEFIEFDETVRTGIRGTIILELQPGDVFSDLRAFEFARGFLRERRYRLCLDGVTPESLTYLNRQQLGFDLIKLHWTNGVDRQVEDGNFAGLKDLVARVGRGQIILHKCDSEDAIDTGQKLGLSMFQGFHVDRMLRPSPGIQKSALSRPSAGAALH